MQTLATMTTRVLQGARNTLSDPARWTQGCSARSADRMPLANAWSPNAVKWCLIGATWKEAHHVFPNAEGDFHQARKLAMRALDLIKRYIGQHQTVNGFNDSPHTRHGHVLEALDRALAASKKRNTLH